MKKLIVGAACLAGLVVPPIESLAHDAMWFARVKDGYAYAAVLRGLREYFD